MGGIGSGMWLRAHRKVRTEQSLILPTRAFRGRVQDGVTGILRWEGWGESPTGYALFQLHVVENETRLTLHYDWRGRKGLSTVVPLTRTPVQWGWRWWFACPMVKNGILCGRRCSKLYLAPTSTVFACRQCHSLTYQSTQTAHSSNRYLRWLGFDPQSTLGFARLPRLMLEPRILAETIQTPKACP